MLSLILFVGSDPEELNRGSRALEAKGHIVKSAYSALDAINEFEQGDFDVILLGSSLCLGDREFLSQRVRAFGSLIPILTAERAEYFASPATAATPAWLSQELSGDGTLLSA